MPIKEEKRRRTEANLGCLEEIASQILCTNCLMWSCQYKAGSSVVAPTTLCLQSAVIDCFWGSIILCTHFGSGWDKAMKCLAVYVIAIYLLSQSGAAVSTSCGDIDNNPFIPLDCCINVTEPELSAFREYCRCEETCGYDPPYTFFCDGMSPIPLLEANPTDNVGCL